MSVGVSGQCFSHFPYALCNGLVEAIGGLFLFFLLDLCETPAVQTFGKLTCAEDTFALVPEDAQTIASGLAW
jgi:hypothetical protein